ncbi:MAG: M20/M25/M40 family metallo-hydrolase [Bacteroidetes bacterium]|nr:M20/M25/M40 family metallo-hydrolase [Bacteroidota bacterium]
MKKATLFILCCLTTVKLFSQESKPGDIRNDSLIQPALQRVNQDSIFNTIATLQDYGSRFMIADNRRGIADYLQGRFSNFGIDSVRIDSFECHTQHASGLDTITWQYNIVATIQGDDLRDEVIVLGAHYDSYSSTSDPMLLAPGADDNGSGIAVCLETARILAEMAFQPHRTFEIVCFAAEEYMLSGISGSEHYANEASVAGRNIVLMINNDMVGYDDGSWTVCLSNYPSCSEETNLICTVISEYTTLNTCLWPSWWQPFADVEPFMDHGYKAVYIEESSFNPFYHTDNDLLQNMSVDFCTEVAKISLGSLLYNDLTVGTDETFREDQEVFVFPNPASNTINIGGITGKIKHIQIIDSYGRVVLSQSPDGQIKIDISLLSNGFYLLSVRTENTLYTSKFLKN